MKRISLLLVLFFLCSALQAQICGTPGLDGAAYIPVYEAGGVSISMNTYFPPKADLSLSAGTNIVQLGAVPVNDIYGNNFGATAISTGDMLLIIQMQDATIKYTNDAFYGSNNDKAGNDGLGGTGYTSLGNTGKFEYVIATNAVPLAGGVLTFRGGGIGKGTVNAYANATATPSHGAKTFQVIRVPQYSNLTLTKNLEIPRFNGKVGGVIAFDVSGTMNLNGFQIDASARGFRGGFGSLSATHSNLSGGYVTLSTDSRGSGKGEGVAGTPRYLLDIYKDGLSHQVDNEIEGLPSGSYGKGAPGNAGGGGNEFNAGGGGGGNGGMGGGGGNGAVFLNDPGLLPNGGRPGSASYDPSTPELSRLIMGGGGGAGQSDFNDSWGAAGGGIILINVGRITGSGKILSNGDPGLSGFYDGNSAFNGASGGGAGGTVLIKVTNPDPSARLTIEAKGGNGGYSKSDRGVACGPGGGGGGGEVFNSLPSASVNIDVGKGFAGFVDGLHNFAADGQDGHSVPFVVTDFLPYLRGGGAFCYPELSTVIASVSPTGVQYAGGMVSYQINTTNYSGGGTAAGVQIQVKLPPGFLYSSATIAYTGEASGPVTVCNLSGDASQPLFGDFKISPGDRIQLILTVSIPCGTQAGIYKSNAQARYLDPTRTLADSGRRITPALNAFPGSNTTYETGIAGLVAGSNYNGDLSTIGDVTVGLPEVNNKIMAPLVTIFCSEGSSGLIEGSAIVAGAGSYTYQWQSSPDGITYQDIPGAIAKDYISPTIQQTTFYRRGIYYSGCKITTLISNVVKLNVIRPLDAVNFDMPDFCLKDASATFINRTPVNDVVETELTYLWDFGDPGSSNPTSEEKNGQHAYTHTGEYITKLTVFRNGICGSTVAKTFRVNGSSPKADFTVQNSTALCSNQEVIFEDHSTVDFGEITRIDWYYDADNNPTVVETDSSPGLRFAGPKLYSHLYPEFAGSVSQEFKVRMVVYSGASCIDERVVTITLRPIPEVDFDVLPAVCSSVAPFQLTQGRETSGLLAGNGIYTGDGVSASGLFNPFAAGAGKHTLTYSFKTINGCSSAIKKQDIFVFGTPIVDAGKDQVILEGGEAQLRGVVTALDDLNLSYKWSPADGLNRDDVLDPVASPTQDMTYQLTVMTVHGCSATDQVSVRVLANLEIPNTFTPNGDGINDEWNIKYLSTYPQATVNVFNRYGGKVYSTTGDVKNWDGKYNGEYVPVGVYYYVIDLKNGKKILSGSLTVLK
ncbi:T9SS type B sorting domain-containing protein [Pedobacter cryoconitis]|uniref:Gliding motility-associated-like protein n=1 Tax=Pedobacter cryoconitis TaxID=188932 RepID=A0A327SVL1_9SPHI|nr:gliding motility-associated C-terminal domain-containing protein [Pedobacter cryoconitis]RAJ33360.1 gliding motility-associated-like protein [Pedobacter cryoconitis]